MILFPRKNYIIFLLFPLKTLNIFKNFCSLVHKFSSKNQDAVIKIMFVCLGNICRSPLAEGIFKRQVADLNLDHKIVCDSAGTSNYHIGQDPDHRTVSNALENGLHLNHKGQQFRIDHFAMYDYIVAMDQSNLEDILLLKEKALFNEYELTKMRQFDNLGKGLDVPDPYFGGPQGFQEVYDILDRSNRSFLDYLIKKHNLTP